MPTQNVGVTLAWPYVERVENCFNCHGGIARVRDRATLEGADAVQHFQNTETARGETAKIFPISRACIFDLGQRKRCTAASFLNLSASQYNLARVALVHDRE